MTKYYIGYHKDLSVTKKSSSGGAFTAISDIILDKYQGVVYGCILNEKLEAIHIRTENKDDRDNMRGSKYIQSNTVNTYKEIEKDLKNNRYVMFSGTPCQISAIKNYLIIKRVSIDNLLTVEVTCHGVGSNKFFKDYIQNLEKKYRGKAIYCNFRAKEKPKKIQQIKILFDNNKKYISPSSSTDWFYTIYLKNLILRPSCYHCKFAQEERFADITIADAWGYKANDNISRSLIIFNTKKSEKIINEISNQMNFIEVSKNDFNQSTMKKATKYPSNRENFWKIYNTKGYLSAQKYIGNNTLKSKMKEVMAKFLYKTNLEKIIKR